MRIDVHEGINLVPTRNCASVLAQNTSGTLNRISNGSPHMPHATQGSLGEYGLEVEIHHMLILDQNTFEGEFLY